MQLTAENLNGRTVIASDGTRVGDVAALFVESTTWCVESIQVKLRKEVADELGAEHSWFSAGTLEIPVRFVQSVGDTLVLLIPAGGLRDVLPDMTDLTVPESSDEPPGQTLA